MNCVSCAGCIVQSLSHPGIPQYIDYFEEDTATDRAFYIVQVIPTTNHLAVMSCDLAAHQQYALTKGNIYACCMPLH